MIDKDWKMAEDLEARLATCEAGLEPFPAAIRPGRSGLHIVDALGIRQAQEDQVTQDAESLPFISVGVRVRYQAVRLGLQELSLLAAEVLTARPVASGRRQYQQQ
jgi:hypothetical protein